MYAAPKANGGSGNGKSHRYSMYGIVYSQIEINYGVTAVLMYKFGY